MYGGVLKEIIFLKIFCVTTKSSNFSPSREEFEWKVKICFDKLTEEKNTQRKGNEHKIILLKLAGASTFKYQAKGEIKCNY